MRGSTEKISNLCKEVEDFCKEDEGSALPIMNSENGELLSINKIAKDFYGFYNEDITKLNIFEPLGEKEENKRSFFQYSRLLEGVMSGIPDIIGVYKPDRTVIMYNKAGHEFFNKEKKALIGMKCYEVFNEESPCKGCSLERAINEKKFIHYERYMERTGKYVDCSYNPILDEEGNVIFVIEQLRDITEEKILGMSLRESEERYRKIVEMSLDGILITVGETVVFANKKIPNMLGKELSEIQNKNIYEFLPKDSMILEKNIKQVLEKKLSKHSFDYKFIDENEKSRYVEVVCSYITYKGEEAVLSIVRNITKMKKDLNRAAELQLEYLPKNFPLKNKMEVEYLYRPAKTVSGDFFDFHKVDEDLVIGILFDVSGKGLSAALSVSAFKVLFNEAASNFKSPRKIAEYLNEKVTTYLGENYIAACIFSLNFKTREARIVSAGINNYIYKNEDKYKKFIIKGIFLGMFEDSSFDEKRMKFYSEDSFLFFSDGLDDIMEGIAEDNKIFKSQGLVELSKLLDEHFLNLDFKKDDCTLVKINIK